jgi:Xaa-Pro aminopeptidase
MTDLGGGEGAVGAELGENQRLGLPLLDYLELQKMLPRAKWRDASELFTRAQTLKSREEIAALRHACEISQRAWEILLTRVHPGATLEDLDKHLAIANIELGAETRSGVPAHVTQLSPTKNDGVLREGDMFKCDFHTSVKGQWSDITRLATVGEPTARMRELHARAVKMTGECIAAIRPGRKAREIAEFNNEQRRAWGIELLVANKRMGHGVGLETTTPPSLNLVDETELAPGMALAVEPVAKTEFGTIQVEECCVVTETGSELLSSGGEKLGTIR